MQRITDKKITWIQPYYDLILNLIPVDSQTILDVGAGSGIFGFIMKKTRSAVITAIEPFEEYNLSHYDNVIKEKWQNISTNALTDRQYDVVTALEVIEHLPRQDVLPFLKWCKYIGKRVIITTPYRFEQQPAYDNNILQIHQSLVTMNDFEQENYKTYLFGTLNMKLLNVKFLINKRFEPLIKRIKIAKITNIIGVYDV